MSPDLTMMNQRAYVCSDARFHLTLERIFRSYCLCHGENVLGSAWPHFSRRKRGAFLPGSNKW